MKVVIIGSGGREHALAYKISKSKSLSKLFIAPGNPGTKNLGENVNLDYNDKKSFIEFCKENKIDLVVVGPELPLIDGIANDLIGNGFKVFGPSKNAARIEGEKSFAKNLMKKFNIPTAAFEVFSKNEINSAIEYLKNSKFPIVIKADGIAAGKGVVIAENFGEAEIAVNQCFVDSAFGSAGDTIVIEEFMTGQEASIFAVTDGDDFVLLPAAQDHKRIGEGDTGKNTGGMGAYAPTPFVDDNMMSLVAQKIIAPTLSALKTVDSKFVGCLYAGIMLTDEGPKVVEFNCRFGDPETQAVLPLLDGDFLQLIYSAASGAIDVNAISYNGGASVCVVAASHGYPDKYEKGKEILGLDSINDDRIIVYHAGTKEINGKIFTNGGRVLGATSIVNKNDLNYAKQTVYKFLQKISFDGIYYRRDISDKALLK